MSVRTASFLALLFLTGCPHAKLPLEDGPESMPPASTFEFLARNQVRRLSDHSGKRLGLGDMVEIPGYAFSDSLGAAVVREDVLAYCLSAGHWSNDQEGTWVVATGNLRYSSTLRQPVIAPGFPPVTGEGSFVLESCSYQFGARLSDVPAKELLELKLNSKVRVIGTLDMGGSIEVSGRPFHHHDQVGIMAEKTVFLLDCPGFAIWPAAAVQEDVTIRGVLGYRPPRFVESATPLGAKPPDPLHGFFLIRECKDIP